MSLLRILAFLVVAAVCCSARVVRRQAQASMDICQVSYVQIRDGDGIDVSSPNYGSGNYPDNAKCATVLHTGQDPIQLVVAFYSEEIEYHSRCSFDCLCMNGVKLCGSWAGKLIFRFLIPPNSNFTISFHTDISVNLAGFSLQIEAWATTSDDGILQPGGGVGSAADKVIYHDVSYSPEYQSAYTDRCAADSNQPYLYNSSSPSYNGTSNNYTTPSNNGI